MKKSLLTILTLATSITAMAQTRPVEAKKSYTDCEVCDTWATYKGKKQHGQKHCVGYITVRKYQTGKIDTLGWSLGSEMWNGNTYDLYMKLSDRNKYIVDSLKEDGVPQLQQNYLTYEPIYMKKGSKVEAFWSIETGDVRILKYLIFNDKNGNGIHLIGEAKLN